MKSTSALLVDDDELLLRLMRFQLEKYKFNCRTAQNPRDAERYLAETTPDIILLDYDLGPGEKTGLELCRSIKSSSNIPIVMITGNDNTQTIVACLDAGADQYVVKPYVPSELMARIRSVLRLYPNNKSQVEKGRLVVEYDGLVLDTVTQELKLDGRTVILSEREAALLEQLIASPGKVVEKEHLYSVIYQQELDPLSRTMDVLLGRVRAKLSSLTDQFMIKTMRNQGYSLFKIPA